MCGKSWDLACINVSTTCKVRSKLDFVHRILLRHVISTSIKQEAPAVISLEAGETDRNQVSDSQLPKRT